MSQGLPVAPQTNLSAASFPEHVFADARSKVPKVPKGKLVPHKHWVPSQRGAKFGHSPLEQSLQSKFPFMSGLQIFESATQDVVGGLFGSIV